MSEPVMPKGFITMKQEDFDRIMEENTQLKSGRYERGDLWKSYEELRAENARLREAVAEEREQCAKLIESKVLETENPKGRWYVGEAMAADIQARGVECSNEERSEGK